MCVVLLTHTLKRGIFMNECHFLGNFVRDPELRNLGTSTVVNFSLAVTRRYKKKADGSTAKEVNFFDFEAWDTGAETISRHFQKGKPIIVHASAKHDVWEAEVDGKKVKRSRVKFRVNSFEFVPGNYDNPQNAEGEAEGEATPTQAATGDIPF